MGSKSAEAYLASPAVVAASAVAGIIDYPNIEEVGKISADVKTNPKPKTETAEVTIISDFPESIKGELVFCHQDNLNTDGIYPGKYTYQDDFTPEQQAGVVMENYDPEFKTIVKEGDLLVGGYNFGTGSSREQAATSLKYKGIRLVLAGSFSETYKRNAINNGFLIIECPELVDDMKAKFGTDKLTVKTGLIATVDFKASKLMTEDKVYSLSPIGVAAQELIVTGGLENWVKEKLGK
jgi:homoaconitate hydratase